MPTLTAHNGSGYVASKRTEVNVNGTYVTAKRVEQNVNGVWTVVWNARTIAIQIVSHIQRQVSFGAAPQYQDEVTLRVVASDGATPSSYLWSGDTPGQTATVTFIGSPYQTNGFTRQETAYSQVSVTIAGQQYEAELQFSYTAGDLA